MKLGDKLDIQGTSKGKGFKVLLRDMDNQEDHWDMVSMYHRRPGSMGPTSTPGGVFPGKKLPGYGDVTVTIQNLVVSWFR